MKRLTTIISAPVAARQAPYLFALDEDGTLWAGEPKYAGDRINCDWKPVTVPASIADVHLRVLAETIHKYAPGVSESLCKQWPVGVAQPESLATFMVFLHREHGRDWS